MHINEINQYLKKLNNTKTNCKDGRLSHEDHLNITEALIKVLNSMKSEKIN